MLDGRLQIYRRADHGPWQAAARVGGQGTERAAGATLTLLLAASQI